jgi:CRISPR-associated protein Csd1
MILQALVGLDRRQTATEGERPVAAELSKEKISFALVIGEDGSLVDQPLDLRMADDRNKLGPRSMDVPQPIKRTSGIAANLLWDKSSYVLGLEADDPKQNEKERLRRATRLPQERMAFVELHRKLLADSDDPGLRALLRFLETWDPGNADPRVTALPDLLGTNIVFRLDGDRCWLHERPAAEALLRKRSGHANSRTALCLVTGEEAPAARLHPAIKGVWGAQSSGASMVSFNLDAFTSYGKDQGLNAPVSEAAASAYGRALNGLLEKGSRRRVQIGDASTVFWAERDAPQAEEAVGFWLGTAAEATDLEGEVDRNETAKLFGVMEQLAAGRPVEALDFSTRIHVLGLSPNAARLSVRFWHVDTLGGLAARFLQHWRDLAIEPSPFKRPPALWRLLIETAVERKSENVPRQLAGELTRAILTGRRYPRSLLATVVMRIRAEGGGINGVRAAICKACLVRDARVDGKEESRYVSLDPDNPDLAYRMGRLFAVLESIQTAAQGQNLNATIRDKYYAAASATPASIFPLLLRNANHHLSGLRKDGKGGLGFTFERRVGEILAVLSDHFPGSFTLADQGRFAIGYYHERFTPRTRTEAETSQSTPEA